MTAEQIKKVEDDIVATLKNVYDPEIPVNIYDLGLIYEIDYTPDGKVVIDMTLTAPNCPVADILVEDIQKEVAKIEGIKDVVINIVFDPPWTKERMSEEAMLELGFM